MPNALIVGAGDGISASVARALIKDGWNVALAGRSVEGREFAGLEAATRHTCDASNTSAVKALFRSVGSRRARTPDFVLYNASARVRGPFLDLDPKAVDRTIAVSAYGAFLVAQEAAQAHGAKGGRHLLHRRLGKREGLRAVGALRHGQVRAARSGAKHGPRAAAQGHPRRPLRHRRRRDLNPQRPADAGKARQPCSIPMPSPQTTWPC